MRICIVGAGAIGGIVGAMLARAGEDVTFIARGETLRALQEHGIRIRHADGREERIAGVRATGEFASGPFEVVLLAMKAHQLPEVAPKIAALLGEATVLVPMQNGVPFWYFHGHGGELAGRIVRSVDPDGALMRCLDPRRVLGSVVYIAGERIAPGHIAHLSGNRFFIGELDGARSERIERVSRAFTAAGFEAPVLEDIRAEVWLKLWGNVAFNPVSALTRATLAGVCGDEHGRALVTQLMREAEAVAKRLGIAMRTSLEKRIDGAARVGGHKTSMLQDVEAGRSLEVDALVGAVVELGEMVGVEVPTIKAIYQATKLLDVTIRSGGARDSRGPR